MKFRLSRRRKKKYKKDLFEKSGWTKILHYYDYLKISNKLNHYSSDLTYGAWNWFYFRRRVDATAMFIILNCPDTGEIDKNTGIWNRYETPKQNVANNEDLLKWYIKYYPNDKLAHHFCKQNRKRFLK